MEQSAVKIGKETHEVSPLLYGLFLEDINFSCDGGLNTNLVANHSFDGVYMDPAFDQMASMETKTPPDIYPDRLRYWETEDADAKSMSENPASEKNPWYARIEISGSGSMRNRGYNGGLQNIGKNAFSIRQGHRYEVSAYLRSVTFYGKVSVAVKDDAGKLLTEKIQLTPDSVWSKSCRTAEGLCSGRGFLEIEFEGSGILDLDCVTFSDTDVWGKGDPRWSGGHFRRDMVETLKELHPKFLRFPGGCIVEGQYPGNEYSWKNTVGPVIDRIPEVNLWGALVGDKGYTQSYQIGFYEYFLLCEDLGIEPLPIVWAGINCQFRSKEALKTESADFSSKVTQNALDLIEYANGDPETSKWAKLRADAGHPEPFHLKMIGIGNENYGPDYHEKFSVVKKAVQERWPDMKCILSSGAFPDGKAFEDTWRAAKADFPDVNIDEHFYKSNEWFYQQIHRYDDYDRNTAKVFVGEYAANDIMTPHKTNTFGSALAEAAFLTGVERNSDVVVMTSYAPLFSMSEGMQWAHNLIWFNPEHILKTPNYFVQQMFGAHLGKEVLDCEGELPADVYISATADQEKYYIKLVNAGNKEASVRLQFDGKTENKAWGLCMHSDDLECVNELSFFGSPIYHVKPESREISCEDGAADCTLLPYSISVYEIKK